MIPWTPQQVAALQGIPRESGDDPLIDGVEDIRDVVFPARAGMIPALFEGLISGLRIPRESGDDPSRPATSQPPPRYSPRERG